MPAPTSPTARLERLELARQRIVAAGDIGKLSAKPMSEMLGVQWTTLREWTRLFTPAQIKGKFTIGGNGAEYSFHPLKTVDLLIKHFKAELAKKNARTKKTTDALGIQVEGEDQPDLAEVSRLVALTNQITQMKIAQGKLVPTELAADLFRQHNSQARDVILGIGSRKDPTGKMSPELRATFDEALRQVALEVFTMGQQLEKKFRAHIQSEGVAGSL